MNTEQIRRIQEMEACLDAAGEAVNELAGALEKYEAAQDSLRKLEEYYGSALWRADYEDDEAGRLPADLKRGVLSEDAVYDLLTGHRELVERLRGAVKRSDDLRAAREEM